MVKSPKQKQQLEDGIRYLDLRVVYKGKNEYYTCHGLYGENIDSVLGQIADFIKTHPKEVIILDFNHFHNMPEATHPGLIAKIKKVFERKLALPSKGYNSNTPLSKFWEAKHQIIAIYAHDAAYDSDLWSEHSISSPWPNKQSLSDLKKAADENLFGSGGPSVLQAVLTPDGNTIKARLKPFSKNPNTLEKFSGAAVKRAMMGDKKTPGWLADWKSKGRKPNILIMDFLADRTLIQSIIDFNKP